MKKAKDIISIYRPCSSSIEWLGDRTVEEMVNDCHRGDWLLWIGKRAGVDIKKLTLEKGLIAQQVEHLMKYQRSKDAVKASIAFGKGEISSEELAAYAADADAARKDSYKKSSDICREIFGTELVEILTAK